jgi:hypothetical protein
MKTASFWGRPNKQPQICKSNQQKEKMETNFCQLKRQNNFEDDDKTQKPTNK